MATPESTVYFENAAGTPGRYTPDARTLGYNIVAGDLAGGGIEDLAAAVYGPAYRSGELDVLLGHGDGTFTVLPQAPSLGLDTGDMITGDFLGNGRLDLALTENSEDVANGPAPPQTTLVILLNNGSGSFSLAPGSPITLPYPPWAVAAGDFNHDGKLDLAVAEQTLATNPHLEGFVQILLGNGDGSFTPAPGGPIELARAELPTGIAVGDFNHDGNLDLALVGYRVAVLLGNGDGTFAPAPGSPFSTSTGIRPDGAPATGPYAPFQVVTGDFNGDGNLDLAVDGSNGQALGVLLGRGNGSFAAIAPGPGFPEYVESAADPDRNAYHSEMIAGDFNADGKLDVGEMAEEEFAGGSPADYLELFLGNGDGTFAPTDFSILQNPAGYASIATADFNGDGRLDFSSAGGGEGGREQRRCGGRAGRPAAF